MPRGQIPRQPSKAGRHDKAKQVGAPSLSRSDRMGKKKADRSKQSKATAKKAPAKAASAAAPKGYNPISPERVKEILKRLSQTYPDAKCALHHNNAWELLVATILSAQCTDVRVNMVTPALFKKYPTAKHFAALKPEELEPDIRSTGFFRNKSKSIVGAAQAVVNEFGGEVPDDMERLLTVPGAARKTANVVLGSWFGKAEGVVVDTHVHRISRRLELTKNDDPKSIEQDLMKVIPREKWIDFAHEIIHHGRALCVARNPKCVDCPLENICHAVDKTWSTVDIHKAAQP
jgi:endonuclease-3